MVYRFGKDARQIGQSCRVQMFRFYAHIAGQADEIFKTKRVFRHHQPEHIQAVGPHGLINIYPFGADGGRDAGADGFATGVGVGRVDGQRVAITQNGGVYVAELLQFGKVFFVFSGIYPPNLPFRIAGGDFFAILKNNAGVLQCGFV